MPEEQEKATLDEATMPQGRGGRIGQKRLSSGGRSGATEAAGQVGEEAVTPTSTPN